jgi:hypothetical protein
METVETKEDWLGLTTGRLDDPLAREWRFNLVLR